RRSRQVPVLEHRSGWIDLPARTLWLLRVGFGIRHISRPARHKPRAPGNSGINKYPANRRRQHLLGAQRQSRLSGRRLHHWAKIGGPAILGWVVGLGIHGPAFDLFPGPAAEYVSSSRHLDGFVERAFRRSLAIYCPA